MTNSENIIRSFYDAFVRLDADTMASLYSPDIVFSDPVFTDVRGKEVGQMWRMLCSKAAGMTIKYRIVSLTESTAVVKWEAQYVFSKTGRPVVNRVTSLLSISNGKIEEHRDSFSFWRWSAQAIGPIGILLGWSPYLKTKVRSQIAQSFSNWLQRE